MTHMRYWAMMLAAAICGGFIAVERFAFAPATAVWIAFGVAIAATVFSLVAFALALARENHTFSGLSALCALAGGWTIIAMRVFATPTVLSLALASGLMRLLFTLPALALHETTIERVVHALELGGTSEAVSASRPNSPAQRGFGARRVSITAEMRSWMYWLAHTTLALAGALVVLMTFALTVPGHHYAASPRWLAFGIGIAATSIAVSSLLERILARDTAGPAEGGITGRRAAIILTTASAVVAIAMIVTMVVLTGTTARWVAFALGCAMVGISLLACVIH